MGEGNDILQLSKDLGKVSERTGKLEEGFSRFEKKIDEFLTEERDRANKREVRDVAIEDHMSKVCALAKIGIFFAKYVLPPGGLVGLLFVARSFGLL